MFQNLSLKGFTWPREPVLYLTVIAAILTTVASVIDGSVNWVDGLEALVIVVGGFIARGQVTPMAGLDA